MKLDYISFFVSQPISFLIALNTYITRGLFYIYVIYLYNILVVIENLLRYIKSDPPDILDYRNTIDIYPDPLYLYNRVFDNILKTFYALIILVSKIYNIPQIKA
jgi:hypothetical protein